MGTKKKERQGQSGLGRQGIISPAGNANAL